MRPRRVVEMVRGQPTSEGAGVRLTRFIGTPALDHVDPFLLLDEFRSDRPGDYIAGFPDHPHRGFETVTYMLAGAMEHRDHKGHVGELTAGGVQWMTAGRGIVHSEMPRQKDGLMWGVQLWVNLPARAKMSPPRYQDLPADRIPESRPAPGIRIRVIAGESGGLRGPVSEVATQPLYLDVALEPPATFTQPIPAGDAALVHVLEGHGLVGGATEGEGATVETGHLAVLGDGEELRVTTAAAAMRFLLLAARPLREPIARYGPFVMNTREEIVQAVEDYAAGKLAE